MKRKTNPNGANQYVHDPRQGLFLGYYTDPKSETFSNALQSALRAGYEREYAESITAQMPTWLSDALGKNDLVRQAEKNLKKFLGDDFKKDKIKADITKFTLERLRKEDYSTRQEQTGKGGGAIEHKDVSPDKLTKEEKLKYLSEILGS